MVVWYMGEIYYNLGFFSLKDVVECFVVDFIVEFVGQMCFKIWVQFDKVVGKVFVIDNLQYFFIGQYVQEVFEEIMFSLSMLFYCGKMVVILVGYIDEMNVLLKSSGIVLFFLNEVVFDDLSEDECMILLG